jgi:hypothetical protein
MDVTVAEAHLKVIRSLMERATVYRAISSATAAVGGLASLAAAAYLLNRSIPDPREFLVVWGAVLLVTSATNAYFITLGAEKRKEPVFSRGMRTTLVGVIPCLASGGLLTIVLFKTCGVAWCSAFWMLFYGLALISSFHFAPRSVLWLGISFLVTSWIVLLLLFWNIIHVDFPAFTGSKLMAASFGLFHLIYAAATWPRKGGLMAALEPNR